MPANITGRGRYEIVLKFYQTKVMSVEIEVRVYTPEENNIGIYVYGIGTVRNPENFYEKINEINVTYRKYRIFIDSSGEIILRLESDNPDKWLLYQDIMIGVRIVEEVYQEFKENSLEWVNGIIVDKEAEL